MTPEQIFGEDPQLVYRPLTPAERDRRENVVSFVDHISEVNFEGFQEIHIIGITAADSARLNNDDITMLPFYVGMVAEDYQYSLTPFEAEAANEIARRTYLKSISDTTYEYNK